MAPYRIDLFYLSLSKSIQVVVVAGHTGGSSLISSSSPVARPTSSSLLLLSSSTITIFHGSKNSQINNITFLLSCHISISRIMYPISRILKNTLLTKQSMTTTNKNNKKEEDQQKKKRKEDHPVRYVGSIFGAPIFRGFQKGPG